MNKNYDKWKGISKENKKLIQEYTNYRLNVIQKAEITVLNEEQTLRKLAKYLKKINLKDANIKDLQDFFSDKRVVKRKTSSDRYATHIIIFDQWLFNLDRRERSKRMKWYRHITKAEIERNKDPNHISNKFITREEYDQLINNLTSIQSKAMWETLYLSGIRNQELLSMKYDSLVECDNGWEIIIYHSKTKPRKVPLADTPENLILWRQNHPNKNNSDGALWLSESNRAFGKPITRQSAVGQKLTSDCNKAKIEKHITPKHFRSTRATIMFGMKSKDGGLIYSDKNMADHFGWTLRQVPTRREEYDLTPYDDLREKVFTKSGKPEDIRVIRADKERIEKHLTDRIKRLEEKNESIDNLNKLYKDKLEEINNNFKSTVFELTKIINKTFFKAEHRKELLKIEEEYKNKNLKLVKDGKITEEEYINGLNSALDEFYNKFPKAIKIKSVQDLEDFRTEKVRPLAKQILKKQTEKLKKV
jgi:site-specific recombinase XerD